MPDTGVQFRRHWVVCVAMADFLEGDPPDPRSTHHEAVVSRNSAMLEEGYSYGGEYGQRFHAIVKVAEDAGALRPGNRRTKPIGQDLALLSIQTMTGQESKHPQTQQSEDIAGTGGNLLLNVGPQPDVQLPTARRNA